MLKLKKYLPILEYTFLITHTINFYIFNTFSHSNLSTIWNWNNLVSIKNQIQYILISKLYLQHWLFLFFCAAVFNHSFIDNLFRYLFLWLSLLIIIFFLRNAYNIIGLRRISKHKNVFENDLLTETHCMHQRIFEYPTNTYLIIKIIFIR